jgi:hypothetical protein
VWDVPPGFGALLHRRLELVGDFRDARDVGHRGRLALTAGP